MARLALLLFVFVATAHAQDCVKRIPIAIFDQNTGWSIRPVAPTALQAKVHDTAVPIVALEYVSTRRLFILIDESGSMNEGTDAQSRYKGAALRFIKQTLRDLITNPPRGLSVQYGLFNDKWVFSEAFISDPKELALRIDDVNARFGQRGHGRTALFDAVHEALARFHEAQPGDSLLLVTDGGDNQSKLSAEKLDRELRAANIRLLGIVQLPSRLEEMRPDWMQQLADNTGGYLLGFSTETSSWEDKKRIADSVNLLRNFWNDKVLAGYVVTIQVPATLTNETKWKLVVKRESDPRLKHAGVMYPDRLSACSVTTATSGR